jgi:hypothetical protein
VVVAAIPLSTWMRRASPPVVSNTVRSRSLGPMAPVVCTAQTFPNQRYELFLVEPRAPAYHRRSIERQTVAEAQFAAEVLVIEVRDPAGAQHLILQVVHALQNELAGNKPRRQVRQPDTNRSKSKNARKRGPTPSLPGNSNNTSRPFLPISQADPHSSQAT